MVITRTHTIKIELPLEMAQATLDAWNRACNFASGVAFENGLVRNAVKLHNLCYRNVKAFGLSAQVAQSAIRHVASKYVTLYKLKRVPKRPCFFKATGAVVLQGGTRGRDFGFRTNGLSIWTVEGRTKGVQFHGGPMLSDYLEHWRLGDGRMFIRKGAVYLSVSFTREVEDLEKPNDAVVGVDRGINYLATATDGKEVLFFGGGHTKHIRTRYQQTRASIQRKKAQRAGMDRDSVQQPGNTRSLRRLLKRQSGKQARFMRNENHVISRRIIDFAQRTGNPTIAIEDLKGISAVSRRSEAGRRDTAVGYRKQQRKDLNEWAYYQLEQFLRYKAEAYGFEVLAVDPKNTSKGCSRCGHVSKSNRHRHAFKCKACSFQSHADLNAARNIRLRGIVGRQVLADDGAPSTVPEARGL